MAEEQQAGGGWLQRVAAALEARNGRQAAAKLLYAALVRQAREPFLFAELQVPDTRDGRLEMVLLHAVVVMRGLQQAGEPGVALSQALFDWMFADIDQHLREWGVGDLSVGKQVKRIAQVFYARAAALDPALAAADPEPLVPVLLHNVYGGDQSGLAPARALARYLVDQAAALRAQPGELLAGRPAFARRAA